MEGIIEKMFDYKIEAAETEKKRYFSNPMLMEPVFNYMDLSFQLFSDVINETYAIVARHINDSASEEITALKMFG